MIRERMNVMRTVFLAQFLQRGPNHAQAYHSRRRIARARATPRERKLLAEAVDFPMLGGIHPPFIGVMPAGFCA
jgi:hypothetical protein